MIKLCRYEGKSVELIPYDDLIQSFHEEEGWSIEDLGTASDNESSVYGMYYGDIDSKPVIFITTAHHGNEWVPIFSSQEFRYIWHKPRLHPNYRVIEELKRHFSIYCFPLINPSGYKLRTESGDENKGRENYNGVDMNRDYITDTPQPETKIVKDKFLELQPITYFDNHSYIITEGFGYGDPAETFYRQLFYYTIDNLSFTIPPYEVNKKAEEVNLTRPFRSHIPRYRDQEYSLGQGKAWANHQISKEGKQPISFLFEEHRRGPTERGMEFGVNSLIVSLYAAYQYFVERKQKTTWRKNIWRN